MLGVDIHVLYVKIDNIISHNQGICLSNKFASVDVQSYSTRFKVALSYYMCFATCLGTHNLA